MKVGVANPRKAQKASEEQQHGQPPPGAGRDRLQPEGASPEETRQQDEGPYFIGNQQHPQRYGPRYPVNQEC